MFRDLIDLIHTNRPEHVVDVYLASKCQSSLILVVMHKHITVININRNLVKHRINIKKNLINPNPASKKQQPLRDDDPERP